MPIIKNDHFYIHFISELKNEAVESYFSPDYWKEKDAIVGSAKGRGTTWFVQMNNMTAALRHYCRGGLLGKIIYDNYIFTGWENTRSIAEFRLLDDLVKAGVNVPRPIAARAIKNKFSYQADLLSERIPNAQDLVAILQKRPIEHNQYKKIGNEIRKMHDLQVNHSDLNIHNLLIDNNNKVWIIDFDKCKKQVGDSWKESNLARLKRSFLKEKIKCSIHFSEENFESLVSGYRET